MMGGFRLAIVSLLLPGCTTTYPSMGDLNHIDVDGDGRTDVFEVVRPDGSIASRTRAPEPGTTPSKTLVLAIDAIPYELFAEMQREGRFRAFYPPSRLLAPFPSLTNVGFTAILRTAPAAAYEDRFYDRESNRMGGGQWDRLANQYRSLAPFHDAFDWEEPHLWGAFVYLNPERVAHMELQRIEEFLLESEDPEILLYVGSTDALGHVLGHSGLREHLRRVDDMIERFLAAGGGDRRIVLCSDHSMSSAPSRMVYLRRPLERAGFRLNDRIDNPGDVVVPAYGLVGSIQLYTSAGLEGEVARAAANAEGVDFAAWLEDGRVRAVDGRGSADPLDRPPLLYPELRRRVEQGLRNHTQRPASVIVSLEDGWHWGSRLFDRIVRIKGTHGSASYSQSVGFLASNVESSPAWIRAEEAYPYLGLSD